MEPKFTPDRIGMSRRTFGKAAVLGAAAVVARDAWPQLPIPIDRLTTAPCRNVVRALGPTLTIGTMLNTTMNAANGLLATMARELNASTGWPSGDMTATERQEAIAAINRIQGHLNIAGDIELKYLYTHDMQTPPSGYNGASWLILYSFWSDPALTSKLTIPFLSLPSRTNGAYDRRKSIQSLFEDDWPKHQLRFFTALGSIPVQDLFVQPRGEVFNFSTGTPAEIDREYAKYRMVRKAFQYGLFNWTDDQDRVFPNGLCYSQSQGGCQSSPGDYCSTDNNGNPSSASDICP